MKKWKEYTPHERRMFIVLVVLVVAVLLSWGRVSESLKKEFRAPASQLPAPSNETSMQ